MTTLLRLLWPYLHRHRRVLFLALAMMVFVDLLAYVIPWTVGYVTDSIYPVINEVGSMRRLVIVSVLLVLTALVRGAVVHGMIRAYWYCAESTVRDLRDALYRKLQHLDISFYDHARTGDLMSRATYDIQILRNVIAFGIEHRVRIIVISVTVFVLMLIQDLTLALAVYVVIPLFGTLIIRYSRRLRSATVEQQQEMGRMNTHLQENITGVRVVKAFAMEEAEIQRFTERNATMLTRDLAAALPQAHLNPLLLMVDGVGALILLVVGGMQVINGGMTLGTLLSFISFLAVMGFPLRILAFNTSLINQGRGAMERILEIINSPDQHRHNLGTLTAPLQGAIRFDKVSFGYNQNTPVLKEISFDVAPGQRIGLFGLTGAGKSTLISLIPRFYAPTSGTILIDGHPVQEWEMQHLRSRIGTVLQETFLFSATIRENIAFARPEATDQEIHAVARHAQLHDFILSLPRGYDTLVGEYGVGLSGGQRQRLAIARTLLQDPQILILDDCTSSLDAVTERKIQQQLRLLMEGRTTIIIAQRLSTLTMADRIIVLDGGTIQDVASHSQLMQRNSLYRTMYQKQEV